MSLTRSGLLSRGNGLPVLRLSPAWTRAHKPTGTYLRRVSEQVVVSRVGRDAISVVERSEIKLGIAKTAYSKEP
jgi:hypothetical protein